MNFTKDFEIASEQEWKDQILSDLKGASIESLNWKSEVGTINPVLYAYEPKYARYQSNNNYPDNSWKIAQSFDCKDAFAANKLILAALAGGVNCIKLLNLNTQELDIVLKDVMIEIIATLVYVPSEDVTDLDLSLQTLLLARGLEREAVEFVALEDPIGCYFSGHVSTIVSPSSHVIVRSEVFEGAGASVQHEIAYTIATGHEYLVQMIEAGVDANIAAQRIHFEISIGNSYFMQIAKISALKSLWQTILSNYEIHSNHLTIHSVTSSFYQSKADVHNNLLRATTSAMAAVIAGVDSMEIHPYDTALEEKQSDGLRLAKNISLLLQEEAYLNQVKDAASGAYYIEQLTDKIIENAWLSFQQIEQIGGILKAFEQEVVQKQIQEDLSNKIEQFKQKELVLIGVNKQPNSKDKYSEEQMAPTFGKFLKPYRLAQTVL